MVPDDDDNDEMESSLAEVEEVAMVADEGHLPTVPRMDALLYVVAVVKSAGAGCKKNLLEDSADRQETKMLSPPQSGCST